MTTIAYRNGIMAADSMLTDYGDIKRNTKKIFVLEDVVIGTAGEDGDILRFIEWWEDGRKASKRPRRSTVTSLHLIIVDAHGQAEIWDENYFGEPTKEPFCAIGSGRAIAYGAFEMGATAKEAVAAACKWNVYTQGPVRTMNVFKALKGK